MVDAATIQHVSEADIAELERQANQTRLDTSHPAMELRTWRPEPAPFEIDRPSPPEVDSGVGEEPRLSPDQSADVGGSLAKRSFDMLVALIALLFVAPLLLAAVVAIWTESGGPVFFRQHRTGRGGQPFVILKLRTMRVLQDGIGVQQATRGDVRITRVGAFLRKTSIDELPQLINVLKGDMSLVGPRPHALAHDELYGAELPEYQLRFRARPGLTGLAQVRGLRGEIHVIEDMARRVASDIEYIDRWSPIEDVKIMLRTVPLLFHDSKAY